MQKKASVSELAAQIVQYLGSISAEVLGVQTSKPAEILDMTPGAYNLNYHVSVDGKRFIFRVNILQQSGLADQINYESDVMMYLYPYQITPKVYLVDNTKSCFDFDVMIEEYLSGPYIALTEQEMPAVATLLAKLHSLDPARVRLITWSRPLEDTLQLVLSDLQEYMAKKQRRRAGDRPHEPVPCESDPGRAGKKRAVCTGWDQPYGCSCRQLYQDQRRLEDDRLGKAAFR